MFQTHQNIINFSQFTMLLTLIELHHSLQIILPQEIEKQIRFHQPRFLITIREDSLITKIQLL